MRQMYASPRRRHWCAHRRSPGGDPDPSHSEWESLSIVSETSTVSGRQRGEGTYDPKMDRKIFLLKVTDDSTGEACWMWRADALALIEKGCSEKAIEVEMRKPLASCSRGLWFYEKCLLGYSLLQIFDEMKQSSPGEVGIQCDVLLRAFYELSQQKGEPVGKYSMCLNSAANKFCIRFPNWPAQKQMPSVRMVAPATEEDDYPPPAQVRTGGQQQRRVLCGC